MRLLYIHQYFITPDKPGGTRSYWFAKALVNNGHHVVMLTSRDVQQRFVEQEDIEGIKVIYIRNAYNNSMGILRRLWAFSKFMIASAWIGYRQKNIDLLYVTSTPLSVGLPALVIKWLKGTRYIFEVRDLWPEVPIQMGAIKNKWIIRLLRYFERKIYANALHIIALSPGMREGVIKAGMPPGKVCMIPNMSKIDEFFLRPQNKKIMQQFGLNETCFNVVHFGAMGIANGLEYIINTAVLLQEAGHHNIHIIFLGDGKTATRLAAICKEHQLRNVKFLGAHPMKIVSEIVNACDCSIVSFSNIPILYTNSPNKLFDSLSAAKPLIVNSNGWTRQLVETYNCGVYVDPEKPQELMNALLAMQANPVLIREMGRNGRRLAESLYDKRILCKQFVNVVEKYV